MTSENNSKILKLLLDYCWQNYLPSECLIPSRRNVEVKWITLLFCIRKVLLSSISWETDYPGRGFRCFPQYLHTIMGGGSSSPGRVKKFSLLHIVQTGSGIHPTSYKMGTGGSFPGVKLQGREADHSPPTSVEVKKMWIYTSTTLYVFMA
jgi:hypothetical protein